MTQKIIIYQVLPRLFGNKNLTRKPGGTIEENGCGKFSDFTPTVLRKLHAAGVSHVWYTGIIRHATMTSYAEHNIPRQHPAIVKGQAGSPYAIVDYYDVCPDLANDVDKRMQEFEQLVARTHRAGMKVVIDFVPNHVARQYHSICKPAGVKDLGEDDNSNIGFDPANNNFYYCPGQSFTPYFDLYHGENEAYTEYPAKATGNDCFNNAPGRNDWYETVKLCYGVDYYAGGTGHFSPTPSTWQKMLHILRFWASKGVDAFRCDMAEMVPAEFWQWVTAQMRKDFPDIVFIGEVYNPQLYRRYVAAGFDYLYDKVGMYDTLCDVLCHRRGTEAITQAWQQTDDIKQHMLYFLENHDELRLASDFMLSDGRRAVPALVVAALLQQSPFMLYFGQTLGEHGMDTEGFSGHDGRTTIFDYWALPSVARALQKKSTADEQALRSIYEKVLAIATTEKAVSKGASFDLMYVNRHCHRQYAFVRKAEDNILFVVVNFEDHPVKTDIYLPSHAFDYLEMLERPYRATDLLTDRSQQQLLVRDQAVSVELEARGAVVWRLE